MVTREEFESILANRGTLIIDGALATELEKRGHDLNHPLWSGKILKEDPHSINQVHLDYYLAGADISITASYQATTQGLREHLGLNDGNAAELIQESVRLAQQARNEAYNQGIDRSRKLLVAGSVGPYGAYLADGSEYRGDYDLTKDEFKQFHKPRIQALVDAGADLIAIETMPKLEEITATLELLHDEFPSTIAWVSCTLKDALHICDGTDFASCLKVVERFPEQVVAFGVNCVPHNFVAEALESIKILTKLPLVCYPNSGEIWDAETKTWSGVQAGERDQVAEIKRWRRIGAKLIGGCCRTGPGYVQTIASTFRE